MKMTKKISQEDQQTIDKLLSERELIKDEQEKIPKDTSLIDLPFLDKRQI